MKSKLFFLILLGSLVALAWVGCKPAAPAAGTAPATATKYFCPMHPTYVSDRPGDCPICHMKLVPQKPSVPTDALTNHNDHAEDAPPGRATIHIPAEKQRLIGLKTTPVAKRPLTRTLHVPGIVTHDENKLVRISPRFGGWVRSLTVNYVGQHVAEGDPLFTAYSPEILAAEKEYLLAWQQVKSSGENASTRSLLAAARQRLHLLEISDTDIRALEQGGEARAEFTWRSPVSGHVTLKNIVAGQSFQPGETLYELADLSDLWIKMAVPESELSGLKTGLLAHVTFPQLPGKTNDSTVTFISPHVDPATRRVEVRVEIPNPGHTLKTELWTEVTLDLETVEALAIPDSAVLDTGTHQIVFVVAEKEYLEPRLVKTGLRSEGFYEIVSGLDEDEEVVTRALFLVDSESQLQAVIAGLGGHKH